MSRGRGEGLGYEKTVCHSENAGLESILVGVPRLDRLAVVPIVCQDGCGIWIGIPYDPPFGIIVESIQTGQVLGAFKVSGQNDMTFAGTVLSLSGLSASLEQEAMAGKRIARAGTHHLRILVSGSLTLHDFFMIMFDLYRPTGHILGKSRRLIGVILFMIVFYGRPEVGDDIYSLAET